VAVYSTVTLRFSAGQYTTAQNSYVSGCMADIVHQTRRREHGRSLRRLSGLQPTDHHNKRLSVSHSGQVNRCLTAQLGYTVPFTLAHTEKYRIGDKFKIQTIHKLNTTQPRKSKQHKTQQNKTSLVQSPLTTLDQETRWAYSTMLPNTQLKVKDCGPITCTLYSVVCGMSI